MLDLSKCKKEGFFVFEGKDHQVYSTKDDIFSRLSGNREISSSHVKKLIKSFSDRYVFTLFFVNENGEILDGQHRDVALTELGYTKYFIIISDTSLEDVRLLQNSKGWTDMDVAHRYAVTGNENYQMFLDFISKYKISTSVAKQILVDENYGDNGLYSKEFSEGEFVVKDYDKSVEYAEMLRDFDFYKSWGTRAHAVSFIRAFKTKGYDHKRMVSVVEDKLHRMPENRVESYYFLRMLQRLYNYGRLKHNRLFFISGDEHQDGRLYWE